MPVFLLLCLLFFGTGIQPGGAEGVTESLSVPRLMVTSYKLEGTLTEQNTASLSVTLTNTHASRAVENIRVGFSSEAVLAAQNASVYVKRLAPGEAYIWRFPITAAGGIVSGNYPAAITAEYETTEGEALSSSDALTLAIVGAAEKEAAPTQPRLVVAEYTIENQWIAPGEERKLTVEIDNKSKTASAKNVKLTLSEDSGEVLFAGTGSVFLDSLNAGASYRWQIAVSAVPTAAVGEKRLTLTAEYEDGTGALSSCTETLRLSVRQMPELTWDGAVLPERIAQGETATVTVTLMNTGKSELYNCTLFFSVDSLITGGSVFVGTLAPGESLPGTANLRADENREGEVNGTLMISYEDAYGESHEETIDLTTRIVKKVEAPSGEGAQEESERKNPLWWLFLLLGLLIGGAGFGIPYAVCVRKQRLLDEERL